MFSLDKPNQLFLKNEAESKKLIIYLHVPKAAGNSSIGSIKSEVGVENFKSIQWNDVDNSWGDFIKEHERRKFKLVSGHFRMKHILELDKYEVDYKLVTFIRHPVERIISQYKYLCTDKDPNYIEFRKKYPNFDDYAYRGVGPNVVSRILVQGALSFEEYLVKIKRKYDFVGVSEHYDFSMLLLMNYLGYDYTVSQKKNVTIKNQHNQFEVSKKTYDYLLEKHSLDVQIFEHFNGLYNDISKKFIHYYIKKINSAESIKA